MDRDVPILALAAGAAIAVVILVALGRGAQDDYLDVRYSSAAPDYPRHEQPAIELGQGLGAAYDVMRGVDGAHVGLTGTTGALFQYGLWGLDSSNDVTFVGERGDRGAFTEIDECADFAAAINEGEYGYVVTTPAYDQDDPESATPPIEAEWIRRLGIEGGSTRTGLVGVWRVSRPLDPARCEGAPVRGAAPEDAPAE
jgi:hypothetical protein